MANSSLNRDQQALVDILRNELTDLIALDHTALEMGGVQALELLEELQLHLENIGNGADLVGLSGLRDCCHHIAQNFALLVQQSHESAGQQVALADDQVTLLCSWGLYLLGYLQVIGNGEAAAQAAVELVTYLADPEWPRPLTGEEQENFIEHFRSSELCSGSDSDLPELVTEEMLSYAIGEDVRPELLQGLLAELPEQVAQFERSVEAYLQSLDLTDLAPAQRLAHTIKGSANVVGIAGVANLMHYTEDLLEAAAREPEALASSFQDLLQDLTDCLANASDHLAGLAEPPDNAGNILQRVLSHIRALRESGSAMDASELPAAIDRLERIEEPRGQFDSNSNGELSAPVSAALFSEEADADSVALQAMAVETHALLASATASQTDMETAAVDGQLAVADQPDSVDSANPPTDPLPNREAEGDHKITIADSLAQELLRLAGETQIGSSQIAARITLVAESARSAESYLHDIKTLSVELEQLVEVQGAGATASSAQGDEGIDPLEMERYNELHSFSHKLLELTTDSHESIQRMLQQVRDLKDAVLDQQQLHKDSQHLVLRLRMVPVSTMIGRFQRCVRQACRLTGKQAQLSVSGSDMLMDSRVLHKITDPIMHLLRNAVDHGLENVEQRLAAGKPPEGQIHLHFQQAGETIVIECGDDGSGLDYKRIAEVACERGLADTGILDDPYRLRHLVLMPGFSTRRSVTQTSGRGIGLDVVASQVRDLKGNLAIESEPGAGCRFSLSVPSSILSGHTLLVRSTGSSGDLTVAVVTRTLEQIIYLTDGDLIEEDGKLFFESKSEPGSEAGTETDAKQETEKTRMPVFELNDLVQIHLAPATTKPKVLLVCRGHDGSTFGVLAEAVTASQDMVIKPLGDYTFKPQGVVGATILGNGRVAPVIDLQEISAVSMDADELAALRTHRTQLAAEQGLDSVPQKPVALVVDDSLSARRALAQFLSDLGMDVRTARDGFEAIEVLNQQRPVLVLVDLEMPRMNGLELTAHIRAKAEWRDLPVIMVTSRTTEKHRQMAASVGVSGYLNKPWSDDELLTSVQQQIA